MITFTRQAASFVRAIWRRRWLATIVAWTAALLGAVVVSLTPERFQATAKVYVDTQTVLKPLMAGLAFQPDIDQQVRMLARTLISRPNVEKLINNPAIGLPKGNAAEINGEVDSLVKAIKVELGGGTNLYTISYRDTDPQRADRLVKALVDLFMDSGADTKRRDSQEASRFIDDQIKTYETKLIEAENRLKEFKLRNMNVAVTNNQDYFARISTLTDEISRLRVTLNAAEQSRDALRRELNSTEPQIVEAAASAAGSLTPDLDNRIEALRRQLDEMLRRYTDEHPDVLATRRTIAQLEAQRRHELDLLRQSSATSRGRAAAAAANPMFQKLRISLAEAEANVASLRGQMSSQQARLEEIRAQAGRMPQAEAELAQLNRDYDIIKKNYEQLVARREAASLGLKIDQQASLADFRVVEPAHVSPTAVFPRRIHLALGVMLLAVAIGMATAYAVSLMNPSFATEKELRDFTKRPVLGALTRVTDPHTLALDRQDRQRLIAAVAGFFVLHAAWLLWMSLRAAS